MNKRPSISIIVATYNSSATLRDTLTSIRQQGISDVEVILQDGGSMDGTLAIAAEFPEVIVSSEEDAGLYDAMNKGITRANGEVVGILNSDDFYADDSVLERVLDVFAQRPEVFAVYGDLEYVAAEDTSRIVRRWLAGGYDVEAWKLGWMPPHPTFFVRREVYDSYGMFNLDLRFAADYEFMLRCLYKCRVKVAYVPHVLVRMRLGGVSNSSWRNRLRANREDRRAWEVNGFRCPPLLGLLKPVRKVLQWI